MNIKQMVLRYSGDLHRENQLCIWTHLLFYNALYYICILCLIAPGDGIDVDLIYITKQEIKKNIKST